MICPTDTNRVWDVAFQWAVSEMVMIGTEPVLIEPSCVQFYESNCPATDPDVCEPEPMQWHDPHQNLLIHTVYALWYLTEPVMPL